MKNSLLYFLLSCTFLFVVGCNNEDAFPDPPEVPADPSQEMPETPETYLVSDPNFEKADLSRVFSQTNPYIWYNVWTSHVVSEYSGNITFKVADDTQRGKVAEMTNDENIVLSNATSWKAFLAQRIKTTAEPELYRLSFWAKRTSGNPTVRIFVKVNSSTNKYFIFDTGKPEIPSGKYTGYCRNLPLETDNWEYFEFEVDFSKTTTNMGSFAYETAETATTEDLTNFAVCIQNNTKGTSIQFDDVNLVKVSDIEEPEEPEEPEVPIRYVLSDPKFEEADLSKVFSQTNPVLYDIWTSHAVSEYATNITYAIANDAERGKVAEMTNDENVVLANATSWKAFIAQRVKTKADPELYRLSFWAKRTLGVPTIRIFAKINSTTNKYFIFDTDKPALPTGKYTGYCKNIPLSADGWQYFEFDLDFSKTTTNMGSFAYETAEAATIEDLTGYAICLQNNTKSTSIQFDDVNLIKVSDIKE